MDRSFIERTDFPTVRRGLDPEAVRAHLARVAEDFEAELRASRPSTAATQAADQVRGIVEAAEATADDIVSRAQEEAQEVLAASRVQAKATRERAEAAAARHLEEVEAAGQRLQERADATEADFERMLEGLRSASDGLLDRLRGGAGEIQGRVEALVSSLSGLAADWEDDDLEEDELELEEDDEVEPEEGLEEEDESDELAEIEQRGADATAEHELAQVVPDVDGGDASEDDLPPGRNGNGGLEGEEGARIVALNMALSGTPRDETARYLADNFDAVDVDSILDDVYARVS